MPAIYRKYRPKNFQNLLGQEVVAQIIRNAAKSDRISHAYLFYGPRGTGKTTTARLIAKVANCEKRRLDSDFHRAGEPCNDCRVCLEIDAGRALDVVEIDAASNRGIDEMRDLKDSAKLSPTSYKFKVFIIDEAHQLTKEAANALLKTLEEPPAHVILILATTEQEKIPVTVASRAQCFTFKKIPVQIIASKLKEIAASEKIKIADGALELIAAAGEGSFRDAESLFEQVASFGGELDIAGVERVIGRAGFSKVALLASFLLKNDIDGAMNCVEKIGEEGYNLTQFNKDLIGYLRRAAALKFSPALENLFQNELTTDELKTMKDHAALFDEVKHLNLLKSLIRAYSEMRYSPLAIAPLEVAIIENLKK